MTANAQLILDLINKSNEHLSAEEIYFKLKNMSLKISQATVYNNLNSLYEEGLIRKIPTGSSSDRYDKTIRHDHLICKKCGKISDVNLYDLSENIRSQIGNDFIDYDLKINYICPDCKKS